MLQHLLIRETQRQCLIMNRVCGLDTIDHSEQAVEQRERACESCCYSDLRTRLSETRKGLNHTSSFITNAAMIQFFMCLNFMGLNITIFLQCHYTAIFSNISYSELCTVTKHNVALYIFSTFLYLIFDQFDILDICPFAMAFLM